MSVLRKLKPQVERQLRNYRDNQLKLYQFRQLGLHQRPTVSIRSGGRYSDPTQNEALRLLDPPAWVRSARRWGWAIQQVYEMLQRTAPKKAILMDRLYGIEQPASHAQEPRVTQLLLVSQLEVSEPTLYKWREEILAEVAVAAIQAGALHPYDTADLRRETI